MMYANFDSISQTANDFTKFHLKTASNDNLTPKFDPLTNEKNPLGKTSAEKFKESVKSADPKTNDPKVKEEEESKTKSAEQEKPVQNAEKSDDTGEVKEENEEEISTEELDEKPATNESTLENLLFLQNPTASPEENNVPNTDIEASEINSDSGIDQKQILAAEDEHDNLDMSTYTQETETETKWALKSKIDVDSVDTLTTDEAIVQNLPQENLHEKNTNARTDHQEQHATDFIAEDRSDTNDSVASQSEESEQTATTSVAEKSSNAKTLEVDTNISKKTDTAKSGYGINIGSTAAEGNRTSDINKAEDSRKFVDNLTKKSILNQTKASIIEGISRGKNSFEFQLNPKDLGTVKLSIDFTGNKGVKINIEASTNTAIEALRQETAAIENTVKELGFELNNGSLTFAFKEQARDQGDSHQNSFMSQTESNGGDFSKPYSMKQQINIVTNSSVDTLV